MVTQKDKGYCFVGIQALKKRWRTSTEQEGDKTNDSREIKHIR
jgi:hypothetical protein